MIGVAFRRYMDTHISYEQDTAIKCQHWDLCAMAYNVIIWRS